MRVTFIQSFLIWENPDANRLMFAQKLAPLRGQTDLVVLPEMFTTGFSMNIHALAEPIDGPTMRWLRATANDLNCAVTGSFICREGDQFFNRLAFVRPDGQVDFYDKKHLFALAGECEHFAAGKKRLTVDWKGFRICPLICYDLRFPVWSRYQQTDPYDLLLYVANWPERRAHHWRTLLQARAIENQAFVVGVNVVGKDGAGLEYLGDSSVIDFSGQVLVQASGGQEGVFTTTLSLEKLRAYRQQLPFLAGSEFSEL